MRSWTSVCALAVTAGCGRFSFDPLTDGGSGDGPDDASVDTALPDTCAQSVASICDSFEGSSFHASWIPDIESGSVTLSSVRLVRGATAMRSHTDLITVPTPMPRAGLQRYDGFPIAGSIVYARVFVYLVSPVSPELNQFINFVNAGFTGMSFGIRNGHVMLNDYESGTLHESTELLPTDRWLCLQFEVPNGIMGVGRYFIDGVENMEVDIPTPAVYPVTTQMYLGTDYPTTLNDLPASDIWFDDLVVDSVPTPCSP